MQISFLTILNNFALTAGLSWTALAQAAASWPGGLRAAIFPARTTMGPSGTEFLQQTTHLSPAEREAAIIAQVLAGNVPSFLNSLVPVKISYSLSDGTSAEAVIQVLPDYLSIGTNEDFVRMPVSFQTAKLLCQLLGLGLPTPRMVDAIYAQAGQHLRPEPLADHFAMTTNAAYSRHNEMINAQSPMHQAGFLVAGHKKDIILSTRQLADPDKIAIYGWHRGAGQPIQKISVAHGQNYADYSHGLRLISATVLLNGKPHSLFDVLESPSLARVLSHEGPMPQLRERVLGSRPALRETFARREAP